MSDLLFILLFCSCCFSVVVIVIGVAFGLQARREKREMNEWFKRNGYRK